MTVLQRVTDALWNPWLLGLFLATGLYFSLCTGFFQIFGARLWLRSTIGCFLRRKRGRTGGGISQFQALSTALAATIGTGSIAGVATAIWLGGPGAVLWMWLSALLGMMTGFAEKTLAVEYRKPDGKGGWLGGPMYYLRDALGSHVLAAWFALACLLAALVGGSLVQAESIASALCSTFGLDRLAVGAALVGVAALVMAGGLGRVARISSFLVPVMALLYIGGGLVVLVVRADRLPGVLGQIMKSALRFRSAAGGGAGYTLAAAMRYGVARGVFTNEAGLGTSAVAHAAADVDHPARQGMWGILEVGVSTLLVCSVTALVILTSDIYDPAAALSGQNPSSGLGAPMTAAAFSGVLGEAGGAIVSLSLLLFALSSILGWSCYGLRSVTYFTKREGPLYLYRAAFLLCTLLGSLWEGKGVWLLVDLSNALLAIPNLAALLMLSPKVLAQLWDFLEVEKN